VRRHHGHFYFFFGVGAACNRLKPRAGPQDVRKDIRTVRELMGHKNINTIQEYSHLADDHQKAAVENMNPLEGRA
jgi:integrase